MSITGNIRTFSVNNGPRTIKSILSSKTASGAGSFSRIDSWNKTTKNIPENNELIEYATKSYVNSSINSAINPINATMNSINSNMNNFATMSYVNTAINSSINSLSLNLNNIDLSAYTTKSYVRSTYVKKDELSEAISEIIIPPQPDLSNYATKDYLTKAISDSILNFENISSFGIVELVSTVVGVYGAGTKVFAPFNFNFTNNVHVQFLNDSSQTFLNNYYLSRDSYAIELIVLNRATNANFAGTVSLIKGTNYNSGNDVVLSTNINSPGISVRTDDDILISAGSYLGFMWVGQGTVSMTITAKLKFII